ncbi:hypothetical protein SAMN04489844_1612 [Nocardioides exalbidus]|uniref:DUF222 domain-containing protein n=1 Tax=Nocardioides exalbidus TaxID=402596 RepID=A0A1H4PH56_9ACTN|nr:DUF222 domain-containing protein [Nocardioides exalbidus]SEC06746.1 hypothetical protein SAMN04489844_1612 [Nocardioides exalbidus]
MHLTAALDELTEAELLDHADEVARTQRECEVQVLRIALQVAVINNPDRLDPEVARLPGRERTRRFGGVGTHDVTEFAATSLGARLGISTGSAHSLMADALDLAIRLPQLWRRVEALEVKASYARFVARRTRDLTIDQALYVDERVVESADGRIPWSRFEDLVTGAIVASDPVAAARKEQENATRQVASPTRSTEDGMRGFFIRAPFHVITKLDATVQWLADILAALGDTDDNDARRVKAVAVLATPHEAVRLIEAFLASQNAVETTEQPDVDWAKVIPTVTLFVHLYGATDPAEATGTARVEGHGPVTEAWVREHLGPHARFTIQPVFDLAGQAPVDAYEIPDRHRRAVHLMTPADTFPWGACTREMQIDHTVPYRSMKDGGPPGQSRVGNYGPMTPFHHRIKTHTSWQVQQPFPGIYVWRDPHGALYLVDHTGTRRVDATPRRSPAEEALHRALFDLAA